MKIFVISPVREIASEVYINVKRYVDDLRAAGYEVYWPYEDTKQQDPTGGLQICIDNCTAIEWANEVHVWWDPDSKGSLFDLGMTFVLRKPLVLINPDIVQKIAKEEKEKRIQKSFSQMILKYAVKGGSK